jgi:hypothetical protein
MQYWRPERWAQSTISVLEVLQRNHPRLKSLPYWEENILQLKPCPEDLLRGLALLLQGSCETLEVISVPLLPPVSTAFYESFSSMIHIENIELYCDLNQVEDICRAMEAATPFKRLRRFSIAIKSVRNAETHNLASRILKFVCVPSLEFLDLDGLRLPDPESWKLPSECNQIAKLCVDFPPWLQQEGPAEAVAEKVALRAIEILSPQLSGKLLLNTTFRERYEHYVPESPDSESRFETSFPDLCSAVTSELVTAALLSSVPDHVVVLNLAKCGVEPPLRGKTRYLVPGAVLYDGRVFKQQPLSHSVFTHEDKSATWYYVQTYTGYSVILASPKVRSCSATGIVGEYYDDDGKYGLFNHPEGKMTVTRNSVSFNGSSREWASTRISDTAFFSTIFKTEELWYYF